jgi:hypothetical protein
MNVPNPKSYTAKAPQARPCNHCHSISCQTGVPLVTQSHLTWGLWGFPMTEGRAPAAWFICSLPISGPSKGLNKYSSFAIAQSSDCTASNLTSWQLPNAIQPTQQLHEFNSGYPNRSKIPFHKQPLPPLTPYATFTYIPFVQPQLPVSVHCMTRR